MEPFKPTDLFHQRWIESAAADTVRRTAPQHRIVENYKACSARNLPRYHQMFGLGSIKRTPIALLGGGPSLKSTLEDIKRFTGPRMACGTAHAWLSEQGISLQYAVIYDPDDSEALFYQNPQPGCVYLVASHCHPKVFEALEGQKVIIWHSAGDLTDKETSEPLVGGGSMVTLRALPLAVIMGYSDFHLFGFDSSFGPDGEEYAYNQKDYGAYMRQAGIVHRIVGDRTFTTNRAFDVQARQFMAMLEKYGHLFRVKVHGDGMIAALMKEAHRGADGL